MIQRFTRILLPALAVAALTPSAATAQSSLKDVVGRLATYVDDYAVRLALVIGSEHYVQEASSSPGDRSKTRRALVSEFAIAHVEDEWLGFRDVYKVDGVAVRDRPDRLRTLFLESPSTAFAQCQRIADESARYNIGLVQRNFNTPVTTLFFFRTKNLDRFRFKRGPEESVGGNRCLRIDYTEHDKPTMITTPQGHHVPANGSVWLDTATGRVFRTRLTLEVPRQVNYVEIVVSYAQEDRLGMMVPIEMRETYEDPNGRLITGYATYSNFKRFETATKVIVR